IGNWELGFGIWRSGIGRRNGLLVFLHFVITNYPLPITNYQLPITHYQLPITNYPLPSTKFK
ncbi:MAG: hypothetical protein EAZ28_16090, partial [Oscillatoriales cyanobacterium]